MTFSDLLTSLIDDFIVPHAVQISLAVEPTDFHGIASEIVGITVEN